MSGVPSNNKYGLNYNYNNNVGRPVSGIGGGQRPITPDKLKNGVRPVS